MIKHFIVIIIAVSVILMPANAYANKGKEIGLTAAYGVVAGTIVGVATLAFSGSPGSHLRNVAVGASLGLYAGILLGAYLAYGVKLDPEVEEDDDDDEYDDEDEDEEEDDESSFLSPEIMQNQNYYTSRTLEFDENFRRFDGLGQGKGLSLVVPVVVYSF